MDTSWTKAIGYCKDEPYFKNALNYYDSLVSNGIVCFPPRELIFNAFKLTAFDNIKVVILGQDPYHNYNEAMGLSFSVPMGIKVPPSLVNIYKELEQDIPGFVIPQHGDLTKWAQQGVLLLNNVLTVSLNQPNSHANQGWEQFTDAVICAINSRLQNVVYILWGSKAQSKGKSIDRANNFVIEAPHPSPLSAYRGFFGGKYFSRANEYLIAHGKSPIDWQV